MGYGSAIENQFVRLGIVAGTGFQLGLNYGGEDLSGMWISSVRLFVLITLNQQAICL
jgi:hypothetical protein